LYTFDESKKYISELVDHFDKNIEIIKKGDSYKEANVEDEFIKPLFKYLNWNISNEGISNLADREFIVQAKGKFGKEPDYLLQIDSKPCFYMEAKHPKYDLFKEIKYIWQAYSYAYSTQSSSDRKKVDFAVLTDFEEFRLFDCTFKAEPKTVNNFVVIDWKYSDFKDNFNNLWDLFERNNVKSGSLKSLYIDEKRIKQNRIPPDIAFLSDLDDEKNGWRIQLARDIKKFNPEFSSDFITTAVQLVLDRLVFIKVLSDKEIEDDFLTQIISAVDKASLKSDENILNESFKEIFDKMNKTYNGSVFEKRTELDLVKLSNKTLHNILKSLQPENSRYNFKVIPVEILGTIYEQFLGKIVITTDKQVKIVEKPDIKKAGGVYYTPQYIVDYIVDNTVGKKLSQCKTLPDLLNLKICDPACGSGSFLLGAYDKLLTWTLEFYNKKNKKNQLTQKEKENIYIGSSGEIRLTSKIKREILKSCIYGVDIDMQAIEVTKFSLSLKALEDATHDELYNELTLFHESVLPDLYYNIVCGNSVVGTEIYTLYKNLNEEEQNKINPFDWNSKGTWNNSLNKFIGKGFPEIINNGGFDIIIGNPPYRREKDFKELLDQIQPSNLGKIFRAPRMDLWYYFVHRGIEILKTDGLFSFIVNSYWLNSTGSEKLINDIKTKTSIEEIFFFHNLKIFKNVSGQHLIFRLSKNHLIDETIIKYVSSDQELSAKDFIQNPQSLKIYKKSHNNIFHGDKIDIEAESNILSLIENNLSLDKYGIIRQGIAENPANINKKTNEKYKNKYQTGEGVFTLTDKELKDLSLSKEEMKLIRPYHDLCDIGRYIIKDKPSLNLIYSTKTTCPNINIYDNLKNHLKRFKVIMDQRRETQKGSIGWWHLHWPRDENIWLSPKVLSIQMGRRPSFVTSLNPTYVSFSVNVFVPYENNKENIEYFNAVLNSKLLWYWFSHKAKKRGVGLEINGNVLSNAPIKKIDFSNNNETRLHNELVDLSKNLKAEYTNQSINNSQENEVVFRKINHLENQIDKNVYELYQIPKDEIENIEKSLF